jgi:hypothetical protein
MNKKLSGYVSKENLEYQWKSEPTACEVWKSMNGKIYKSANDIPDRPHPNCKCWIDVLEKEPQQTITDPIKNYQEKLKDKKRDELELAKLLGDVKSLEEEIEEYIRQSEEQENEIAKFEQEFDIETLEEKDKQKLSDLKEQIDYAQYKGQKAKTDIQNLKTEIQNAKGTIEEITKFEFEIRKINSNIQQLSRATLNKIIEIIDVFTKLNESADLWKLSSSKFKEGLEYIKNNGELLTNIDKINDMQTRNFIRKKVKQQMKTDDCKGIVLNSNSSLSKKIVGSFAIRKFIRKNKNKFQPNATISNNTLKFGILNFDLFNALHFADIINIQILEDETFVAEIVDTYDFNDGSKYPAVRWAGELQKRNMIENYFLIIKIEIPKSVWSKY